MGISNLSIRFDFPVAKEQKSFVPLSGRERSDERLRSGGESIGSSKSKARFSGQGRLLGCFGIYLLLDMVRVGGQCG